MKEIRLELYKLRHKRLLWMVVLFLLAEIGWAFTATAMSISRNPDQAGWAPLMAMVASMNGLFLPVLAAICVSRICDMEHKGNTWKLLLTLSVRRSALYAAKYVAASMVLLAACSLQVFAIAAFGVIHEFEQPVPFVLLARFWAGTALTTLIIIALQQWVSLAAKNQAFALALGLIGGFLGLTADLLPSGVSRFFVWSYYSRLSPISPSYTGETLQFAVRDTSASLAMMAALTAAGMAIYLAGSLHAARQEG